MLLLALLLAAPATPTTGVELTYQGALYNGAQATPLTMTMTADSTHLRVDFGDPSFFVVADTAKREVATFVPGKDLCFRIPDAEFADVQIAAIRKYQREVMNNNQLNAAQRAGLMDGSEASIKQIKAAKPNRKQLFTWKQHTKLQDFECELYAVTEAGVDVGQACLMVKGKPPAKFELSVVEGDWWRGIDTLRAAERLPVLFSRKKDGELLSRVTLRARKEKAVEPGTFLSEKVCKPWREVIGGQ
ncbi:MAG: hypothetical protein JST92_12280 [Deltaproteobacteria bacterium]|nr:hypothetical protein [Deltaproteobacteria bacterium]